MTWGGSRENRCRFPLEIVRRVRAAVGPDFILDLPAVRARSRGRRQYVRRRVWLLGELERAGVTLINTGIGWHEARVPTIAGMVPRAAFSWVTAGFKAAPRVRL